MGGHQITSVAIIGAGASGKASDRSYVHPVTQLDTSQALPQPQHSLRSSTSIESRCSNVEKRPEEHGSTVPTEGDVCASVLIWPIQDI